MHVFWFYVLCLRSSQSDKFMAFLYGCNLQSFTVLIFSVLCYVFNFSIALCLLQPVDLVCSWAHI